MGDRARIYAASFLRALANGLAGVVLGIYLAKLGHSVVTLGLVLSAGLVQLLVVSSTFSANVYPTIGASGGVFGILLAFGVLYPNRIVVLLIPPIPMPAWFFVCAYGLIELVSGVVGTKSGIAHFAHLGGMVGAYAALRYWRPRR